MNKLKLIFMIFSSFGICFQSVSQCYDVEFGRVEYNVVVNDEAQTGVYTFLDSGRVKIFQNVTDSIDFIKDETEYDSLCFSEFSIKESLFKQLTLDLFKCPNLGKGKKMILKDLECLSKRFEVKIGARYMYGVVYSYRNIPIKGTISVSGKNGNSYLEPTYSESFVMTYLQIGRGIYDSRGKRLTKK